MRSNFFIPSEYLYPSTLADLRPTMPNRLGPTLFFPASMVWHSEHFLNAAFPASTSCPKAGWIARNDVRAVKTKEWIRKRIHSPASSFDPGTKRRPFVIPMMAARCTPGALSINAQSCRDPVLLDEQDCVR